MTKEELIKVLDRRNNNWLVREYIDFLWEFRTGINFQGNYLRFISFEVYIENIGGLDLTGHDVGYMYNSIYTSLSGGFDNKIKNSGHLTLISLFFYLRKMGIDYWDLGMDMDYKR